MTEGEWWLVALIVAVPVALFGAAELYSWRHRQREKGVAQRRKSRDRSPV